MNNTELTLDQELSLIELEGVNGAFWQRIALRFIRQNGKKAIIFYAGLAGGLAGGADFEKAAHEAGKNAGIVNSGSTNVVDNGDGKGCTDRNLPF